MRFLHCEQCGRTERVLLGGIEDEDAAAFRRVHAACRVKVYEPTGRSVASGPWHDPMSRRQIEIRGEDGVGLAVGERTDVDEPIRWRIECGPVREESHVELDRALFWAVVERALAPHHIPRRILEEWAAQLEHFARGARPSDIVLLEDDPSCGDAAHACFTMTASARLESALPSFGFDPVTEERLHALFEDDLFPPLRVRRRLVRPTPGEHTPSSLEPLARPIAPSLTR